MATSMLTVHAGDWGETKACLKQTWTTGGRIILPIGLFKASDTYELNRDIVALELATKESVKRLGGTLGWGVAGAALLGPVGLLAGLLLGGKGKNVTFVCVFKDGKKILATTNNKTYIKFLAGLQTQMAAAPSAPANASQPSPVNRANPAPAAAVPTARPASRTPVREHITYLSAP